MVNISKVALGPGTCLTDALSEAGIDYEKVEVHPWPSLREIKGICDSLQLKFHARETNTLPPKNAPVIAIYCTEGIKSHAEYTVDLESLRLRERGRDFIAYIELPNLEA